MNVNILDGKKHIHFIGIGGSGMYPLAQILHAKGYYLTGSDNNETETLNAVRKMGIPVFLGQKAENINGSDLIVHTAAIMEDNPELIAAKASGVPVLERSELLGIVTSWYKNSVCVCGTHGKTTTTSMITQILWTQGVDLSAFIGGKLPCIGGSGRAGKSDTMVCEACEFVDTFLKLYPDVAVVLNIDADHLDYFKTLNNIILSFTKFCKLVTNEIIANGDDLNTLKAIEEITDKKITLFGLDPQNDYYAENVEYVNGMQTKYDFMYKGRKISDIVLNVAGKHNVLNSLAAAVAALNSGAEPWAIKKGLEEFRGAGRRFELIGKVDGITIVDDYAHHPTEIKTTLEAAMNMGYRKVWAIFQPFTFSRTKILLDDFATSLAIADEVVLTDIMGSREKNTFNIYSKDLAEKIEGSICFEEHNEGNISENDKKELNFQDVCNFICENAKENDLVITLGCGDVYKVAKMIYNKLKVTSKS